MAGTSRLNKALWTNITRLKLLTKKDAPVRFILEQSPFKEDEEDDKDTPEQDEYVIVGRIFPESDIFKQGSYRIEIKLTENYPQEAPEIRFLTPVYHPNIEENGKSTHASFKMQKHQQKNVHVFVSINLT